MAEDLRFKGKTVEVKLTKIVDIFARLPDGSPMWIEAVDGLENARARVRQLRQISPRDYFLFSEQNGRVQREEYPAAQ